MPTRIDEIVWREGHFAARPGQCPSHPCQSGIQTDIRHALWVLRGDGPHQKALETRGDFPRPGAVPGQLRHVSQQVEGSGVTVTQAASEGRGAGRDPVENASEHGGREVRAARGGKEQ